MFWMTLAFGTKIYFLFLSPAVADPKYIYLGSHRLRIKIKDIFIFREKDGIKGKQYKSKRLPKNSVFVRIAKKSIFP